ncbi:MAG: family transcriptional regulator, dissimilatory nitrate respiration regulator, partial [Pseudomonadota bacterium]|nr:family transcriptional regulator, dissimilatory nitrate respiration regulator [Pseudomonadota bacterium]
EDVENYSLRSSTQRLIGFLLQLAGASTGNATELELPASKQVIASRLNLTPETLSRVLHNLSESGLIRVNGRHIAVPDVGRLKEFDGIHYPVCTRKLG